MILSVFRVQVVWFLPIKKRDLDIHKASYINFVKIIVSDITTE